MNQGAWLLSPHPLYHRALQHATHSHRNERKQAQWLRAQTVDLGSHGSHPGSALYWLCDPGQVTPPSVSPHL